MLLQGGRLKGTSLSFGRNRHEATEVQMIFGWFCMIVSARIRNWGLSVQTILKIALISLLC